jgi:hypothetical protein
MFFLLIFGLELALDLSPPTYASPVAGITGVSHYTQPYFLMV